MVAPFRTAKTCLTAIAGFTAALSMSAAPVSAAEMPGNLVRPALASAWMTDFGSSRYDQQADTADWRRCWRRWGCRGRGWRGRRGVSAGDVLAGAVIIGGIAAIASAASNNRRERERDVVVVERDRVRYDDRYDERRYDDRRYDDRRYDDRRYEQSRRHDDRRSPSLRAGASGLESAVDMCLTEIERDARVEEVDNVQRTASGWAVTGSLYDGSAFLCSIGNDGRVENIDYGGFVGRSEVGTEARETSVSPRLRPEMAGGEQWSDVRYLTARANIEERDGFGPQPDEEMRVALITSRRDVEAAFAGRGSIVRYADDRRAGPLVPLRAERAPAYPGGPVPGETIPDRRPIDGDLDR